MKLFLFFKYLISVNKGNLWY